MNFMKNSIKNTSIVQVVLLLNLIFIIVNLESQNDNTKIVKRDKENTTKSDSVLVDSAAVKDSVKIDSVLYSADSVFYYHKEETIELAGNATINYHGSEIKSDTISLNLQQEKAFTHGNTWMRDGDQLMLGDQVSYKFDSKLGLITKGASKFDNGYFYGQEIRKVDKDIYDIDDSKYTTCDALNPHFYIYSQKTRIYRKDKFVAKPIIYYVNHFPILAFPFGTFTLKKGKHSGILVPEPGYNDYHGKYVKNIAVYLTYKDYADYTLSMDYYEKTGWEIRFLNRYIKRYLFNGNLEARLRKDIKGFNKSTYDWYIRERHHHEVGYESTFDANLKFASSQEIWEGSSDINERLKQELTSSLSFKTPLLERTLSISANYTDDFLEKEKDITLPYIRYSLPSKPVYELFVNKESNTDYSDKWWKDFSISYRFLGVHRGDINEDNPDFSDIIYKSQKDSTGYINIHNAGIKHSSSISYSTRFWGWLNIKPSLSANEVWFDRDKYNKKLVRAADYSSRISSSFSLYGMGKYPNFFISAVRHIVRPSISFTYRPDLTKNKDKYYSFNGISVSSSDKSRIIRFSLSNNWSIKLGNSKDENNNMKINNLLSLDSSTNYNLENDEKPFSDIRHSLSINIPKISFLADLNFSNSGSITQNPYNFNVEKWSTNNSLKIGGESSFRNYFPVIKNPFKTNKMFVDDSVETDSTSLGNDLPEPRLEDNVERKKWSFNFYHDYTKNLLDNNYTSQLRSSFNLPITHNLEISYENVMDLKENELVSQSLNLSRKIHCWKLTFRWSKAGDIWDYRLKFFNITLPESMKIRKSENN